MAYKVILQHNFIDPDLTRVELPMLTSALMVRLLISNLTIMTCPSQARQICIGFYEDILIVHSGCGSTY